MAEESHLSIIAQQGVEEGHAVLAEAVGAYTQALRERLVAAYALGSLAHGGFSPLVSDVDLGLILADPLHPTDSETVAAVARDLKAKGSALHKQLSVFWGTPSSLEGRVPGGRFPPLDRLDLLEHGCLLWGEEVRNSLVTPDRDELLLAGALFALEYLGGVGPPHEHSGQELGSLHHGDDAIEEIRCPELLLARGIRRVTKLVLFPVRFLFTAETGRVATNDTAVAHYLAAGDPPGAALVGAALTWRTAPPENEEAILSLLETGMVPLYLHYIDDHRARLAALGRDDLSEAFGQWGRRLLQ